VASRRVKVGDLDKKLCTLEEAIASAKESRRKFDKADS
jgi:hypothetical protein